MDAFTLGHTKGSTKSLQLLAARTTFESSPLQLLFRGATVTTSGHSPKVGQVIPCGCPADNQPPTSILFQHEWFYDSEVKGRANLFPFTCPNSGDEFKGGFLSSGIDVFSRFCTELPRADRKGPCWPMLSIFQQCIYIYIWPLKASLPYWWYMTEIKPN